MGAVAERRIGTTGTPESLWAEPLRRVPVCRLDALVQASSRLVVVAPHPDDEVLACGGLVFEHVARGGDVCVIGVTDGEASHPDSEVWTRTALAEQRRRESDAGLRLLGVAEAQVVRLGFPDGSVARYAGPLRESLGQCVRPDDVVVCTWQLDGHPDHEAVGAAVQAACDDTGARCLQVPVWMWHWSHDGDDAVPWHLLRGLPLSPTALARKRAALSAHVTQLTPRGARTEPVLDPLIVARASRPAEYFFVAS